MSSLIRKKIVKDMVCTNCGSKKHTFKQCAEPVTSWGVILVTFGDLKRPQHDKPVDLSDSDMCETQSRVLIESKTDRMIVSVAYHTIKFLMVSRKYSVGYVEFIRGRYRPEKIDQVIYLFKQMMQSEIDDIGYALTLEDGFEYLWKKFWGAKASSPYLSNDKKVSRDNFKMLRTKGVEGPELDLEYIVSTVKAEYEIEEWGFPKGRKNRFETDEICAIREFKEESGYADDDFKIIKQIAPIVEEFNGTNGVRYKHIYYIAELLTDKPPRNNITDSQKDEIGNIQFMDFTTALEYIRDYHIPRKVLLQKLFTYYLDRLVLSNRPNNESSKLSTLKDSAESTASRELKESIDLTESMDTTDNKNSTNTESTIAKENDDSEDDAIDINKLSNIRVKKSQHSTMPNVKMDVDVVAYSSDQTEDDLAWSIAYSDPEYNNNLRNIRS